MMAWILARSTSSRTEVFRHMRSQFGEADPELWWKIPFVLTLLAIALLLLAILARNERKRLQQQTTPQPIKLYLGSLIKLKIPWRDIFHLWRLARALKLKHPTVLLISAAKYDDAVTQYCADGRQSHANTYKRFTTIRNTLFSTDSITAPTPAPAPPQ